MGSFSQLLYFLGVYKIDMAIALLGYVIFHYFVQRKVKGPRIWPLVGMLPSLFFHLNDIYDWLTDNLKVCGGTFTFKGPIMSDLFSVVTADPKNLEHVLKLKFWNFPKGAHFRTLGHDFLGDGIFNADDETWRKQRRTANIEFNTPSFRAFMVRSVEELVEGRLLTVLDAAARSGEAVDLQYVLLRFTFDNVCKLALGVDPGCLGGKGMEALGFARAFEEATEVTMLRFVMPTAAWKLMRFFHVGPERKLRASLATVDEFVNKVIRIRNSAPFPAEGADLLSAFMKIKTKDGSSVYTGEMLRDISVNFILAGRDTSSVALSWFFWLLARHPAVEERILVEIRSILSNRSSSASTCGPLNFSVEEVKDMQYLQAALSESLRLYPSVPVDQKQVDSDDCLPDGTYLKKGTKVIYSIYSMGRMESIWGKDCMEFKPERWVDMGGNFVSESAYKYPAFNGGPRLCLGKEFAYYQMKWIAATVIWRFRLKMVEGHVVEPKLALTLYMKNGFLVTLQPREDAVSL